MTDPIERVVQAASGTASNSRTFQNSETAELYGVEIEGRKEFVLTDDYNNTLFVSFNAAYIESEVTLLSGDRVPAGPAGVHRRTLWSATTISPAATS
jgi:hypothetical protein